MSVYESTKQKEVDLIVAVPEQVKSKRSVVRKHDSSATLSDRLLHPDTSKGESGAAQAPQSSANQFLFQSQSQLSLILGELEAIAQKKRDEEDCEDSELSYPSVKVGQSPARRLPVSSLERKQKRRQDRARLHMSVTVERRK